MSIKSSPKDESEELETEIEQLLTCLKVEKPKSSSDNHLLTHLVTSRSHEIPRYSSFNPFPSRSFNENVAMNGYRLGLYSPVLTSR